MNNDFTVQIKGLDELSENLEKLGDGMAQGEALAECLEPAAELLKQRIAANAPRDTGFMADHIDTSTPKIGNASAHVNVRPSKSKYPKNPATSERQKVRNRKGKLVDKNAAMVALYNEFGTSKMPKRPFITQAFESTRRDAENLIVTRLRALLERLKS